VSGHRKKPAHTKGKDWERRCATELEAAGVNVCRPATQQRARQDRGDLVLHAGEMTLTAQCKAVAGPRIDQAKRWLEDANRQSAASQSDGAVVLIKPDQTMTGRQRAAWYAGWALMDIGTLAALLAQLERLTRSTLCLTRLVTEANPPPDTSPAATP
jgi:Holliday junction resolvase